MSVTVICFVLADVVYLLICLRMTEWKGAFLCFSTCFVLIVCICRFLRALVSQILSVFSITPLVWCIVVASTGVDTM